MSHHPSSDLGCTFFVDTSILVCARDSTAGQNQAHADQWITHLWRTRTGRLSVQVLWEYYDTVTRRMHPGLEPSVAREDIRDLQAWQPIAPDDSVLEATWGLEAQAGLGFWDALVVGTAQAAGCRFLLTGTLAHGRRFDTLEVVNPFDGPPPPFHLHQPTSEYLVEYPRDAAEDSTGEP